MENIANSHSVIMVITAMTLIGLGLKTIRSWVNLVDEHLLKRPFKKLAFLKGECVDNPELSKLIQTAKEEAIFKSLFGRTVNIEFMQAVAALVASNQVSVMELRTTFDYLKFDGKALKVELGIGARFSVWLIAAYIVGMGYYTFFLVFNILELEASFSVLLSLIFLIGVYLFFVVYLGRDVRAIILSTRLKTKLKTLTNSS